MSFLLCLLISLFLGYFVWRFFTGKWQEVYITQNVEQYMTVSGALQGAGLRYKSSTGGQEFNAHRSIGAGNLPSVSYSIMVPENQTHLAQQLINEILY